MNRRREAKGLDFKTLVKEKGLINGCTRYKGFVRIYKGGKYGSAWLQSLGFREFGSCGLAVDRHLLFEGSRARPGGYFPFSVPYIIFGSLL